MYQIFTGTIQSVEDFLNGRSLSRAFPRSGLPVGGLTLTLTAPAMTVTFSGGAGEMRTAQEIVNEINAVTAGLAVLRNIQAAPAGTVGSTGRPDPEVRVVLYHTGGIAVNPASTSQPFFIFPNATPIAAANIISFVSDAAKGHSHVLVNHP